MAMLQTQTQSAAAEEQDREARSADSFEPTSTSFAPAPSAAEALPPPSRSLSSPPSTVSLKTRPSRSPIGPPPDMPLPAPPSTPPRRDSDQPGLKATSPRASPLSSIAMHAAAGLQTVLSPVQPSNTTSAPVASSTPFPSRPLVLPRLVASHSSPPRANLSSPPRGPRTAPAGAGRRSSITISKSSGPPPRPERDPPVWTLPLPLRRPATAPASTTAARRVPPPPEFDDASSETDAGFADATSSAYDSASETDDDRFFDASENDHEEDGNLSGLRKIEEVDDENLVTPTVATFNIKPRSLPPSFVSSAPSVSPPPSEPPSNKTGKRSPKALVRVAALHSGPPPSPPPTAPLPPLPKSPDRAKAVGGGKKRPKSKLGRNKPEGPVVIPKRSSSVGLSQSGKKRRDSESLSMTTSASESRASSIYSSQSVKSIKHPYAARCSTSILASTEPSSSASSSVRLEEMDLDALLQAINVASTAQGEEPLSSSGIGEAEWTHPFAAASAASTTEKDVSRPRTADVAVIPQRTASASHTVVRRPATADVLPPPPRAVGLDEELGFRRPSNGSVAVTEESPVLPWDEDSTAAFPSPPPSRKASPSTVIKGLGFVDADDEEKVKKMEKRALSLDEEVAALEASFAAATELAKGTRSNRVRPASSPQTSSALSTRPEARPLSAPSPSAAPALEGATMPGEGHVQNRVGRSGTTLSTSSSIPSSTTSASPSTLIGGGIEGARQNSFRWSLDTASTGLTGVSVGSAGEKMLELQEVEEPTGGAVKEDGASEVDSPTAEEFEIPAHCAPFVSGDRDDWSPVSSRRTSRHSNPSHRVVIQSPPSSNPSSLHRLSNTSSMKRLSNGSSAAGASSPLLSASRRPSTAPSTGAASDDSRWSTYAQKFLGPNIVPLARAVSPPRRPSSPVTAPALASSQQSPAAASILSLQSSAMTARASTGLTKSFKSFRRVMGLKRENSYPPPSSVSQSVTDLRPQNEAPPQLALLHIRSQGVVAAAGTA